MWSCLGRCGQEIRLDLVGQSEGHTVATVHQQRQ
jgi:hypothetical protein